MTLTTDNSTHYLDTASSPNGTFALTTDSSKAGLFTFSACGIYSTDMRGNVQLTNGANKALTWLGVDTNLVVRVLAEEPDYGSADGQTTIWQLDYYDAITMSWVDSGDDSLGMITSPLFFAPQQSVTTVQLSRSDSGVGFALVIPPPAPPTVPAFSSCSGSVVCATNSTCTPVNNKDVPAIVDLLPIISTFDLNQTKSFEGYFKTVNSSATNLAVCLAPKDVTFLQTLETLVERFRF